MHQTIHPKSFYYGFPVILLTTCDAAGATNITPISSSWCLGDNLVIGLSTNSKAFENLQAVAEAVINLPDDGLWAQVEGLATLTGKNPVPETKQDAYRHRADKMSTDNRVAFHRIANTLNYLDIKTVVVSCGTCYDQLEKYRFEDIFPGCRIIDIHEYLLEKGVKLNGVQGQQYLYHDPCHTPIKTMNATQMASELIGKKVVLSDRCCGESGMFAVKRPDIATQVKFRKQEEIEKNLKQLPQGEPVKMLTTCPACLQGLSRYADDNNLPADYIVIEMARHILGENWLDEFVKKANAGGVEKIRL